MKTATLLVVSCLNSMVLSSPLSSPVECYSSGLAPLEDCRAVLASLDREWRQPGVNVRRTWGRFGQSNETHVGIPVAFILRSTGHSQQINKCVFQVDVRSDRTQATDEFTLQQLTLAASRVLNQCYPQGKTGYGFPTSAENVYVTPIKRSVFEMERVLNLGEINGTSLWSEEFRPLYSPERVVDVPHIER